MTKKEALKAIFKSKLSSFGSDSMALIQRVPDESFAEVDEMSMTIAAFVTGLPGLFEEEVKRFAELTKVERLEELAKNVTDLSLELSIERRLSDENYN